MSNKIYCGTGKEKVFSDGGSVINVTLSLDGMKQWFEEYGFTTDAGKKKLGLVVQRRREPDQYGHTHNLMINTYKPEQSHRPEENQKAESGPEEDIPF